MITILLLDKEIAHNNHFHSALGQAGHRCVAHADARTGLLDLAYQPHRFDVILVGDNLDISVRDLIMRIQRGFDAHPAPPIIALYDGKEARQDNSVEKIEGEILACGSRVQIELLDAGADRVLPKPLRIDLVVAMINAAARRWRSPIPEILRFRDGDASLALDTGTRMGNLRGASFELTSKEYELLELFMRHPRQVLTRNAIYDQVWGYDYGGGSNVIEVYVRYLRKKIEDNGNPRLIHTVRGVGYVLRAAG